jgi:N-methylhydantoinase A
MRIAIDTGGTFTDCVYMKNSTLAVLKVLSTPGDPARAVLEAIHQIAVAMDIEDPSSSSDSPQGQGHSQQGRPAHRAQPLEIRHGTTIGTNALLERKGARVAFVTTAGFEDTIAIARQNRQLLYNWMATPKPCLVPAELRFGIDERVSAEGAILRSPTEDELIALSKKIHASGAESIAISLLFSFANPENERRVSRACQAMAGLAGSDTDVHQAEESSADREALLRKTPEAGNYQTYGGVPISVSHQILPEFREYERAATTAVNAYLAPKAGAYVDRLKNAIEAARQGSLDVMQSSGGIVSGAIAAQEPVRTILSGPAGGLIGAHRVAQLAGLENIISFDMGGTSTDVSLIDASGPRTTNEARVSEIPVSVPMLDIHTVGAGGGSLAWFDRGGILHVGPTSAGADPGPICYGRGVQPTVTDANLVLGKLDPQQSFAGSVRLEEARTREFMEKARGPIRSVEEFAAGIVRLAEAEMEKAIRLISVERGHDPRDFTLVCFGGAGPLHACTLARALGIPRVLVPAMPGALSALGILIADVVRDYARTVMMRIQQAQASDLVARLESHFAELEAKAAAEFSREGLAGVAARSADLRYAGQGYELNVSAGPEMCANFHAAHRKRYGHAEEARDVEVVSVRLRMIAAEEAIDLPRNRRADRDCSGAVLKHKLVRFDDQWLKTTVLDRARLRPGNAFNGPVIVHEYSATTAIPPDSSAKVDEYSNILIDL